ncbi:MAG: iron-containing redox enzyme family protein [Nitrososphaerota archaeon]|nr:iron-containing redox enzyme family protein [Nitrososphaerota archaeon]MDG6967305.1 iron-containing redox enzyme family protein [Nitrososphaerota archaeon]MDG6977936.1 iron-containing redox enzyme family protein [Nitrososphaerota archaeon]MDG7006067.1 iron-containing redox enzyme family protein [Nitrososphaerota archaeon]MDG7020831.1 iron-containing redox enzyme family protein [Nitrososphaerota archaeon]
MSDLVRDLDASVEDKSLLRHCFYKMWTEGKLTREHLAGYSKEYFQLVRAVPDLVDNVGRFVADSKTKGEVAEILAEEAEHVGMWVKFAEAMGVSRKELLAYAGTRKTREAVERLKSVTGMSFCQGAAAMYAIESEQPRIAKTKLEGLVAFYGMSGDGDGAVYFREHEVADVRHAAVWRGHLEKDVPKRDQGVALDAAGVSLAAQNAILDSVMETYVGQPA